MANKELIDSCQSPGYVFQSFYTLYDCYQVRHSLPDFNRTVSLCLRDYCQAPIPSLKGCPTGDSPGTVEFSISSTPWKHFSDQNGHCENVSKTANTDIGGPGIFYSYLIQVLMLFLIWMILRFFKIVPKVCRQVSWVSRRANRTKFSDTAADRSSKIAKFFDKQDFILKAILVEFQETQCFFMVACQAVVLFSKNHHNIFGATSMVNVWADHSIAGMCAAAGSFPVVWSLWTLQRSNMASGWILFLSTATLGAAQAALFYMHKMPALREMGHLDGLFPESCGRHPPPVRYCGWEGLQDTMVTNGLLMTYVNPVTLMVYGITVAMFFWPLLEKMLALRVASDSRPRLAHFSSRVSILWHAEWFRILRGVITSLIEILLLATFLMYIVSLCFAAYGVTQVNMEVIDWTAWGFGQFVALTTWAAVFCKYLYWTIFGTEAYAASRFGQGNHITQEGDSGSRKDVEKMSMKPKDYHSLGVSRNDLEMTPFGGARFYQNQGDSEPPRNIHDPLNSHPGPHVGSAPFESATGFIKADNDPAPRLSLHIPPREESHIEQDVLQDGPEQERYDSEAHLIRKNP